jgi:outer membrane protein assembly factor BamB
MIHAIMLCLTVIVASVILPNNDSFGYECKYRISGAKKQLSYESTPVSVPALSRDEKTFYFTNYNGLIIALNTNNDTLWTYQTPGHLLYSPTVGYNGIIYCAGISVGPDSCSILTALTPDGSCLWTYDLGAGSIGPIATTPDGMIYVATEDSLIHGIDSNANELWTCQVKGSYYREMVVGTDGSIYATSAYSDIPVVIYAISKNGKKLWECELPGAVSGSGYLVWGNNVLYYFDFYGAYVDGNYIGVSDGLYAINLDGTLRFHRLQPIISTQLAVSKDTIYAMGEYATFFALTTDGYLKWERQLSDKNWHRSSITPIIGKNNIIYAADFTSDDFIHAITSDGEVLWTIETGLRGFILDSHGMLHWFYGILHNSTQTTSLGIDAEAPWPCEGGNFQRTYCVMAQKEVSVSDNIRQDDFALLMNTPNPFNPSTAISFNLPASGKATLIVYDITGRKVRELVSGMLSAGKNTAVWDGRDDSGRPVSSGVYFSRLTMGKKAVVGKMLLMK